MPIHQKVIPFVNNKGSVMHLPSSMTLDELVLRGVKVTMEPVGTPLRDGEWRDTGVADTPLPKKSND